MKGFCVVVVVVVVDNDDDGADDNDNDDGVSSWWLTTTDWHSHQRWFPSNRYFYRTLSVWHWEIYFISQQFTHPDCDSKACSDA